MPSISNVLQSCVIQRLHIIRGVLILGYLCIARTEGGMCRQFKFTDWHIIILQCLKAVNDSPCHHCVKIILRAFDVEIGIFEKWDAVLNVLCFQSSAYLVGDTANVICVVEYPAIVCSQWQLERIGIWTSNLWQVAKDVAFEVEGYSAWCGEVNLQSLAVVYDV